MIVPASLSDFKSKNDLQLETTSPPPSEELPTFEESTSSQALHIQPFDPLVPPNPFQDPPPDFSPYIASYSTQPDGSIVSHDAHLNEDGEALYRFLLTHASTPPTYHLHIRGTHREIRTRLMNSHCHHNNHSHHNGRVKTETYTEIVVDFDFRIDLTPNIITDAQFSPVQWSVHDDEPAYRGRMFQQIDTPTFPLGVTTQRKASRKELDEWKVWWRERDAKGLPPWTSGSFTPSTDNELKSSRTVRQWCDDYCCSKKCLKEFIYAKAIYGWDIRRITAALNTLIVAESGYTGDLLIKFTPEPRSSNLIIVRPTNGLSKALSNMWIKFFLVITLIYPFVWLFKRFHSHGGGVWKVCGGGYPLKVVQHIPHETLLDVGTSGSSRSNITYTEEIVGEREGAWFKRWEPTVRQCVLRKRKDPVPLVHPYDYRLVNSNAASLDGYREDI